MNNEKLDSYINIAHVFLDTWPFVGGFTPDIFAINGVPVLSMLSQDWDLLILKKRLNKLIAHDENQYIKIAIELINNEKFYHDCCEESKLMEKKFQEKNNIVKTLEEVIQKSYFNIKDSS